MKKYIIAFGIALAVLPSAVSAKSFPVGGGLFPVFGQVPDTEDDVKGLRINAGWGHHHTVYGLDLSVVVESHL